MPEREIYSRKALSSLCAVNALMVPCLITWAVDMVQAPFLVKWGGMKPIILFVQGHTK